jgi:hypothetical protein
MYTYTGVFGDMIAPMEKDFPWRPASYLGHVVLVLDDTNPRVPVRGTARTNTSKCVFLLCSSFLLSRALSASSAFTSFTSSSSSSSLQSWSPSQAEERRTAAVELAASYTGHKRRFCNVGGCSCADFMFDSAEQARLHQHFLHSPESSKGSRCPVCDRSFTQVSSLQTHARNFHGLQHPAPNSGLHVTTTSAVATTRTPGRYCLPHMEEMLKPVWIAARSLALDPNSRQAARLPSGGKNISRIDSPTSMASFRNDCCYLAGLALLTGNLHFDRLCNRHCAHPYLTRSRFV